MKNILIRPATRVDIPLLHRYRNDPVFRRNCTHRKTIVSIEEFTDEMNSDFRADRWLQYILVIGHTPIGTMWAYRRNKIHARTYISIFLAGEHAKKGLGYQIMCAFIQILFRKYALFKICVEVYGPNQIAIQPLLKAGWKQEAEFRDHCLIDGQRVNLHVFSFFQTDFTTKFVKIAQTCTVIE